MEEKTGLTETERVSSRFHWLY